MSHLVSFVCGDAEAVRLEGGKYDAAICECAFCTFPDKRAAARELARLLRPGGRVGISDLTRSGDLPPELQGILAWVACIADALPVGEYAARLGEAGIGVDLVEAHKEALAEMADAIRSKLVAASFLTETGRLDLGGLDLKQARALARAARHAIRAGTLGYAILCGTKSAAAS